MSTQNRPPRTFVRNGQTLRIVYPGDTVRLRTGGANMIVTAVSGPNEAQMVTVQVAGKRTFTSPANFFVFVREGKGPA